MLEVPLDFSPVGIHKSLEVAQAPTEERLKLVPRDWDRNLCVMSLLVLLPAEADPVPKEKRGKGNLGKSCSSGGSKVVLTLLTKVVAIHVGLSAVYVWRAGLQLLLGHLRNDGSWDESENRSGSGNGSSSFQNDLKNPLQVILRVLGDTSISRRLRP